MIYKLKLNAWEGHGESESFSKVLQGHTSLVGDYEDFNNDSFRRQGGKKKRKKIRGKKKKKRKREMDFSFLQSFIP